MTPTLEIDHVTVRFGHAAPAWQRSLGLAARPVTAVDDVTMDVAAGAAVGLVGESGSGKSTLMRSVMGLNDLTSGEVRFRGAPLARRRSLAVRRAIQMVFQDPGTTLNPARTVGSVLAELLRVHGVVPPGEVDARIRTLLEQVHLPATIADERPRRLSGGQKQRVAIARALALEPEVLIADEATSALDVVIQAGVLDLLRELRRTTGITLICVTHDLDLVRYVCDTVVVLRNGRVAEQGAVATVFASPADEYTVELIASAPTLAAAGQGRDS
ncbi:MAG: ABC transporter ATP-binding protein [Nocardioidaceae bacterium]